jgi:hypothetical protein
VVLIDLSNKGRVRGMHGRAIATAGSRPESIMTSTPLYVMSVKSRPGSSACRHIVIVQVLPQTSASIIEDELRISGHLPYANAK